MESIAVALFEEEDQAFAAYEELRDNADMDGTVISQMAIVKKLDGSVTTMESFDSGKDTTDDTWKGSLIGLMVGILGGPLGMLLGGGMGALIGSNLDKDDAEEEATIIEKVALRMNDGDKAVIMLIHKKEGNALDEELGRYKCDVIYYDADDVRQEVEDARAIQKELAKQAKKELRKKKRKQKLL